MIENPTPAPRVSVAISGNMLQFNITLFVLGLLTLGFLFICSRSSDPIFIYGGLAIAIVCIVAIITFTICFYSKQKSRPLDGQSVDISIKNQAGNELSIRNPPDSFFEQGEMNAIARLMLVGYDENLCPDGEVIGKASEQNYRKYSQEEKELFVKQHRNEIGGKKKQAEKLLLSGEAKQSQVDSSDTTPNESATKT